MSRTLVGTLCLTLLACACSKSASSGGSSEPVATWKGGKITDADLDEATFSQRQQALDQLVVKKLVEAKAAQEKLKPEELIKREVKDKVQAPSEADMKAFYDMQVKQVPAGQQSQIPPFEQVKGQIAQYMVQPQLQAAQQKFVDGLKKENDVKLLLKLPARVAGEGPSKGPAKAAVTIVEFSDYQCPYCSRAEETVKQLMKDYEGKVRLVYREFPLPFHPQAQKAAEAAQCAGQQSKYWEMHEKLFANQQALEPTALKGYAKDLGLDQAKFDKCLDEGATEAAVKASRDAGEAVGVQGTPAFFVNNVFINGARPIEDFKKTIDEELAR